MLVIVQDDKKTPINNPILNELAAELEQVRKDKNKYSEEYYSELDWLAFNAITCAFKAVGNALNVAPAELEREDGTWITGTEI